MDSRDYKELLVFGLEGTSSSNGVIEKDFMEKEARGWALDDARVVEFGGCGREDWDLHCRGQEGTCRSSRRRNSVQTWLLAGGAHGVWP